MNILMNLSDNKIRDNRIRGSGGDGYGGDIINNWSGGLYLGNGYGGGLGIHGGGWSGPSLGLVEIIRERPGSEFGGNGDGFGSAGVGLANNDDGSGA